MPNTPILPYPFQLPQDYYDKNLPAPAPTIPVIPVPVSPPTTPSQGAVNYGGIYYGDFPPDDPNYGWLWTTTAGVMYVYIEPGVWNPITSSGGGLPDAPSDGTLYGRESAAWVHAVPLAGGTMTGLLVLSADPTATSGAATKHYVDNSISSIPAPPSPSSATPGMDGTGAAGASALYSRGDHIHPTDTSRYAASNPAGYISGNQTITLSGDTSGSGATAITTTLATVNSNVGTFQGITVNGKGLVTAAVNAGYLTGNQTITLTGDVSGSGTTAITATLATVNSNVGTFQGITVNGKGLVTAAVNAGYLTDAPTSGNLYCRASGAWASTGTFTGPITVSNNLTLNNGNITVNGPNYAGITLNKTASGNSSTIFAQMNTNYRWQLALGNTNTETGTGNTGSDFNLTRYTDAGATIDYSIYIYRGTGQALFVNQQYSLDMSGNALKPVAGPWGAISDARIKNVIGDYTAGIDEIMKLKPVRYTWLANDTITEPPEGTSAPYRESPHYGVYASGAIGISFIAQDVENIMPEMVRMETRYIDGQKVEDMRALDTNALIFALVNAVQNLNRRVKILESQT